MSTKERFGLAFAVFLAGSLCRSALIGSRYAKVADLVGLIGVTAWLYVGVSLTITPYSSHRVARIYLRGVGLLMIMNGLLLGCGMVSSLLGITVTR